MASPGNEAKTWLVFRLHFCYLISEHVQSIETRVDPTQEVVQGRGLNEIHSMCTEVIGNFGVEREGRLEGERERERERKEIV